MEVPPSDVQVLFLEVAREMLGVPHTSSAGDGPLRVRNGRSLAVPRSGVEPRRGTGWGRVPVGPEDRPENRSSDARPGMEGRLPLPGAVQERNISGPLAG